MFAGCSRHGERASPADADDAVSADRAARAAAFLAIATPWCNSAIVMAVISAVIMWWLKKNRWL